MEKYTCQNCGAEVTTELCPYCNSLTGIDSSKVTTEYPIEDCNEASINLKIIMPLLLMFGLFFYGGLNVATTYYPPGVEEMKMYKIGTTVLAIILYLISLLPLITALIPILRNIKVKIRGKEIEGIIYGYVDDDSMIINGNLTKAIKILIDTPKGKRFIIYKTSDTKKNYKLNSKIKLLVYKKLYLMKTKKEYLFE